MIIILQRLETSMFYQTIISLLPGCKSRQQRGLRDDALFGKNDCCCPRGGCNSAEAIVAAQAGAMIGSEAQHQQSKLWSWPGDVPMLPGAGLSVSRWSSDCRSRSAAKLSGNNSDVAPLADTRW